MGSVNVKVFSVVGRITIKLIRLEYFPVMIRSRIAGNNSLRIFPVGNACDDNGSDGLGAACAQFGRALTMKGCRICVTVRLPSGRSERHCAGKQIRTPP